MSDSMRFRWARYLGRQNVDQPNLRVLNNWLQEEVKTYEWLTPSTKSQQSGGNKGTDKSSRARATTLTASEAGQTRDRNTPQKCPIEGEGHSVESCPKFKAMSVAERSAVVKEHRLCWVCLKKNCWVKKCKAKRCGVGDCKKNHHKLLHIFYDEVRLTAAAEHTGISQHQSRTVLLQVVPVRLHGPAGFVDTCAMIDSGSTCSLLEARVAKKIGLRGASRQLDLSGIRERSLVTSEQVNLTLSSKQGGQCHQVEKVWVVDDLNLPRVTVDVTVEQHFPHLKGLALPMVKDKEVSLLLGNDAMDIVKPLEVRSGPKGTPHAINTLLGWTVVGPVSPVQGRSNPERVFMVSADVHDPDSELRTMVKDWWTTESFGCSYDVKNPRSMEDRRAVEILESTTRFVDGRYETGLLWKADGMTLPNNRSMAEQRLNSLERKLDRNPELKVAYEKTITDDLSKGYARKLSPAEVEVSHDRQWFLPHHPVLNPNKPGKVRRVFDAAARYQGVSLNDCLLTGPNLLNPLIGVLMRFREERIALTADIEAMYSQVMVPGVDQPSLRFLWREDRNKPPDVFQFQRHIFGATSSPTSALFSLQCAAKAGEQHYEQAAKVMLDDFYMDDCLTSVPSAPEAIELQQGLTTLCGSGGFRLTKWLSNSDDVLSAIPEEELAPSLKDINARGPESQNSSVERVLGIRWDTQQDAFVFDLNKPSVVGGHTPRQILSIVASIYDPLGLLAPATLYPKLLMQELWRQKLGWDDEVSETDRNAFEDWFRSLEILKELLIPRFYRHVDLVYSSVQLHIMVDASEKAFSAVAFYRFEYVDGKIGCSFVIGKSRVAPVKPLTIPKLELQAAVLGVRLAQTVQKESSYQFKASEICYWSDSSTVIQWIQSTTGRHPTFIASRVAEILDSSDPQQWRHVPGRVNVADDGSRGLPAEKLTADSRWFTGPAFLLMKQDNWPEQNINKCDTGSDSGKYVGHADVAQAAEPTVVIEVDRFSSWNRLWRSLARVLRFVDNCRVQVADRIHGPLTVKEKERAEKLLIKQSQAEDFQKEIESLKVGKPVGRHSEIKKLAPFLDKDGILRSRGRIGKSDASEAVKYPIILGKKSRVTNLIIMQAHRSTHHEGLDHLRHFLRQRFWIVSARSTIRRVVHRCIFCRIRNAQPKAPMMGDLPNVRVRGDKPCFYATGVDYFGPILVRKLRKTEKRYGCLFVCMATKSVHIEMAHSLDTDSFVMALRRFIARRGHPAAIYSDNGTNFVGGERELRQCLESWNQQQISDELLQQNIEWHFNPPGAPHFGGLWERLVKSVKRSMRAVLIGKNTVLTDEVLNTVLVESEALLNSRPLTAAGDDVTDLQALTPNHFLLGRPSPNLPPDVFYDRELSSRRRWRQAQTLVNHMWKRWSHEYLPTLNERKRWWGSNATPIQVGDLVLLVDHGQPRGHWLLGRVTKVFPGEDNVVRVVEIKTKNGLLKRPVVKLAPLNTE